MVPAIRDHIKVTCSPDKFTELDGQYTVNNLYFDTPDLRFYNDTKLKRFERFKPRVRFYGDGSEGSLWLELKHKLKNVTWKVRRRIHEDEWDHVLRNEINPELKTLRRTRLVESFEDALTVYGASPILFVRYNREPWVSDVDRYARITFDRDLSYCMADGSMSLKPPSPYIFYDDAVSTMNSCDESPVLLEIKTETRVPVWVVNLIRRFELNQRGFSKYCYAVDHSLSYTLPEARVGVFPMSGSLR
jgi:hypothetical protein